MPQHKVAGIIRQVCQAVNELHSYHIIHRDIKPENILCDHNTGKLILTDFGLSQMILPNSKLSEPCGTIDYVAPEVLGLRLVT